MNKGKISYGFVLEFNDSVGVIISNFLKYYFLAIDCMDADLTKGDFVRFKIDEYSDDEINGMDRYARFVKRENPDITMNERILLEKKKQELCYDAYIHNKNSIKKHEKN